MDTIGAREEIARFPAGQDAPTLAQVLLDLAEDHEPVYQRLVRLRLRDKATELRAEERRFVYSECPAALPRR